MASQRLSLNDVSIRFEGELLLEHVNLSVSAGERVVLIGPSGQGKTVLLKLFAGLIAPSSGEVLIDGHPVACESYHGTHETQLKLSMLFQKNALFDSLRCGENMAFPLREKFKLSEVEIAKRVNELLEAVGLLEAIDRYPSELSGGMQKRLGIARALILTPEIVLYDDPTAGLDPITSRRIVDLILTLSTKHRSTVVAVTNDMSRAYQLADRIAMVIDREVIVTGNREQTLAHPDPRVHQFVRGLLTGPLTEAM